jgi:flagellar motor component MotA
MRLLYLLGGLGMIITACAMGVHIQAFINIPSLLITVGGGLLFTLTAHGAGSLKAAVDVGFFDKAAADNDAKKHAQVLQTLRTTVLASGGLGLVIGWVQMLVQLDDPTQIGPAIAVSILTVLYAIFLAELIVAPAIHRVRVKALSQVSAG